MADPLVGHPTTDPGDGRVRCPGCQRYVWLVIHSCPRATYRAVVREVEHQIFYGELCRDTEDGPAASGEFAWGCSCGAGEAGFRGTEALSEVQTLAERHADDVIPEEAVL